MPSLPPPADPHALYILDLSGFVFRAYYALPPMSSRDGTPTNAIVGVLSMIQKVLVQCQPKYFAVAVDSRGKSIRREMYADYKSTRKETPKELIQQIERLVPMMADLGLPTFAAEGYEADDVIATLVRWGRERGMKVVIVSADKDLLQLVTPDILMFDTMRNRLFGPDEAKEKMGVGPEQIGDYLALTGDSSDNIPGVPGVGPKSAAELLASFGDLQTIFASLDKISKKALREKLEKNHALALLSRQLVTLHSDVEVAVDEAALTVKPINQTKLKTDLIALDLHRTVAELGLGAASTTTKVEVKRFEVTSRLIQDATQLQTFLEGEGELGWFTVAQGPHPMRSEVAGLSLSRVSGSKVDVGYLPIVQRNLSRESTVDLDVLKTILNRWASARKASLIAHDLKRECALWGRMGVELGSSDADFDVMIASYLVDAEGHRHDLIALADRITGTPIPPDGKSDRADAEATETAGYSSLVHQTLWTAGKSLLSKLESEKLWSLFSDIEMPLCRVLSEMERVGVAIDADILAGQSEVLLARSKSLESKCYQLAGREFQLSSPRALETVLFDELELRVVKKTKTGRSTDADVLEELSEDHPLPFAILEWRSLQKLLSTYIDALPKEVDATTGRIHTIFNQTIAATGRLSSSQPNLQNIPIRSIEGRAVRLAFVPRPGWQMVSADYSQIELRVLAHASSDTELVRAYQQNLDVHSLTAQAIFAVSPEGVTREMRAQAKTVNFAVIYGQTQFALARNLDITKTEAQRYINAFFEKYSGAARYLEERIVEAQKNGGVRTLLGRWRRVPEILNRNRPVRWAAERIARNTPIQGTAADIMKLAMIAVQKELKDAKLKSEMVLSVHDELLFEVPPDEAAEVMALAKRVMEAAYKMSVPLLVEPNVGSSWGAVH